MTTGEQKKTAEAIVNIFETGLALGDYGNVTLLIGDAGHLTYGRSQTTLASGNLLLLIKAYVEAQDTHYADQLRSYLSRLQQIDLSLDNDFAFRDLLRRAGSDPVMHAVQDAFFDRVYWTPAEAAANQLHISTALGCCVIYDSTVHGSWRTMRDRTIARFSSPSSVGENEWITHYVSVRRDWLATNENALLRRTVYRMDELGKLITAHNWSLNLPLLIRGITIDAAVLAGGPVRASAQTVEERLLALRTPMSQGEDVRNVQDALRSRGYSLEVDGVYGLATEAAVRSCQEKEGLAADGIVGPATRTALGL